MWAETQYMRLCNVKWSLKNLLGPLCKSFAFETREWDKCKTVLLFDSESQDKYTI